MCFLRNALDAGKPGTGFSALALTSNDVKDAPILRIGAMPLHLQDTTDAGKPIKISKFAASIYN